MIGWERLQIGIEKRLVSPAYASAFGLDGDVRQLRIQIADFGFQRGQLIFGRYTRDRSRTSVTSDSA